MRQEVDPWLETVEPYLPGRLGSVARLHGGDDSDVFRLTGSGFDLVLHALPRWVDRARAEWVQVLVRRVRDAVPEAVPPVVVGETSGPERADRILTLSEYVSGSPLDRESDPQRTSAAQVLARIHRVTAQWDDAPPEVPLKGGPRPPAVPEVFRDEHLVDWWESTRGERVQAITHGDYYRGNLICSTDRVVGVVDWNEARVRPLLIEVAAATFEMCRDDHHALVLDRASAFLAEYRSADGPVPLQESSDLVRAMRIWVREDAVASLAYSGGEPTEYVRGQARAFEDLRAAESVALW